MNHVQSEFEPSTAVRVSRTLGAFPTGYLHLGHAQTFWTAYRRAQQHRGTLVFRNEDLDAARCRNSDYLSAIIEDLHWLGISWQEGPDCGGASAYHQSERGPLYRAAFQSLRNASIYPCTCSRQDVLRALRAPHPDEDEPIYPGTCRPPAAEGLASNPVGKVNWRFRTPEGECVRFVDGYQGPQQFIAGTDFGDFVVWRHDDSPAYQLAVVVDDAAMGITEVVRGADLLRSTARQLLLLPGTAAAGPIVLPLSARY